MSDDPPAHLDVLGTDRTLTIRRIAGRTFGTVSLDNVAWSDLSPWLEKTYGIHVPDVLSGLTLKFLQVTASTNGSTWQEVTFEATSDFSLAGIAAELGVEFRTAGNKAAPPTQAGSSELHTAVGLTLTLRDGSVLDFQGRLDCTTQDGLSMSLMWSGENVRVADVVDLFGTGDATAEVEGLLPTDVSAQLDLTYRAKDASVALRCSTPGFSVGLASVKG